MTNKDEAFWMMTVVALFELVAITYMIATWAPKP